MIRINRTLIIMAAFSLIFGYSSCGKDSDPVTPAPPQEPVVLDFLEPVLYPIEAYVDWIGVSDLDSDGDNDIIVSHCCNENTFYIFLNNSDGSFQPGTERAIPCEGDYIFTMDFDSDGDEDIIVSGDYKSLIYVLLNYGDATFQAPASIISEPFAEYYRSMKLVDLDSDGDEDLVVSSGYPAGIFIMLNNGDATFQAPILSLTLEEYIDSMTFADLNGDGNADMIGTTGMTYIITSLGNGDGTFQAAKRHSFLLWDLLATDLSVCIPSDMDGDGNKEVIVGSKWDGMFILLDAGDITYKMAAYYEEPRSFFFGAAADLDDNGHDDFVAWDRYTDSVTVFQGGGDIAFESRRTYYTGFDNFVLSDLDGDGDIDIAGTGFRSVSIMLNTLNDQDR